MRSQDEKSRCGAWGKFKFDPSGLKPDHYHDVIVTTAAILLVRPLLSSNSHPIPMLVAQERESAHPSLLRTFIEEHRVEHAHQLHGVNSDLLPDRMERLCFYFCCNLSLFLLFSSPKKKINKSGNDERQNCILLIFLPTLL